MESGSLPGRVNMSADMRAALMRQARLANATRRLRARSCLCHKLTRTNASAILALLGGALSTSFRAMR